MTLVIPDFPTIQWIAQKFGTDIHLPLRMNVYNFGDPLNSLSLSSAVIKSKFLFVQYFDL